MKTKMTVITTLGDRYEGAVWEEDELDVFRLRSALDKISKLEDISVRLSETETIYFNPACVAAVIYEEIDNGNEG